MRMLRNTEHRKQAHGDQQVSKLVFYAQSTSEVISSDPQRPSDNEKTQQ